jgi:hypothetical protein
MLPDPREGKVEEEQPVAKFRRGQEATSEEKCALPIGASEIITEN